jgi:hypothetical protein
MNVSEFSAIRCRCAIPLVKIIGGVIYAEPASWVPGGIP